MSIRIKSTAERFSDLPIAHTPSNEPYGVQADKEAAKARAEVRRDFLNGAEDEPEIDYPQLNESGLEIQLRMIDQLIDDIEYAPEDTDPAEQDALYDILTQKREEILRHLTIARLVGREAVSPWLETVSSKDLERRAAEHNCEIFGRPNVAVFNYLLAEARRKAIETLQSDDTEVARIAQEFLDMTHDVEGRERAEPVELDAEYLVTLKTDLFAVMPALESMTQLDVPETVSAVDAIPYVDAALAAMGLTEKGYRARRTHGSALEENPKMHVVDVGENRRDFDGSSGNDVIATSVHEAIHILRHQNAQEQPDPSKRMTSRANILAEEGLCVVVEQIVREENVTRGVPYYIAAGLQMGIDITGNNRSVDARDFRQTHEILWRWSVIMEGAGDIAKQKETAYARVMRTRRGGALDTRDIQYFAADQNIKEWLQSLRNLPAEERQEKLRWALSAQFDPNDPGDADRFATINRMREGEE